MQRKHAHSSVENQFAIHCAEQIQQIFNTFLYFGPKRKTVSKPPD